MHVSTFSIYYFYFSIGKPLSFKNTALNKPAESSSVWGDAMSVHSPQEMTDGNRSPVNMMCAATKTESQPWLRVDLQSVHQVDHVIVYPGKWYMV
jgi:hypothetical protein